jgi:peptidoglycan/xylan/chitin deacetylase (PgdA/CDA1 family)
MARDRLRILACAAALALDAGALVQGQQPGRREMAVTFDDLPWVSVLPNGIEHARPLSAALLQSLRRHGVPAIGFVNEIRLERDGVVQPGRVALLEAWISAGFELGNHTYSHIDLHAAPVDDVIADVVRGEPVTRSLLAKKGKRLRYFRHPFLHRGRDAETRLQLEEYLQDHGYRVAPVTIDNYDDVFAAAFDHALAAGDEAAAGRIATTYLDYLRDVVSYYEQQSSALFGREIRQVLLLHANQLNARTFDALAGSLRARGYRFVTLDRALEDRAYGSPEAYFGAAGITWIHRWAITLGKPRSFFAGEPEVPDWITRASEREAVWRGF